MEQAAFVGLGAMGYHMAGHVNTYSKTAGNGPILVWNRTFTVAQKHAAEHQTKAVATLREVAGANIVFMCLPTSDTVRDVVRQILAACAPDHTVLFIDCTSGDPAVTQQIAAEASKAGGHEMVDAPVSGGPAGARAGKLAVLAGGSAAALHRAGPWLQCFAKQVERLGPVGAGHATKAVNNALNATHLLAGAEGLLALQGFGIAPERALAAINAASGRSLQTEQRLPQKVLTGSFDYGFKLGLMHKDLRIARGLMGRTALPPGSTCDYFTRTCHLFEAAEHSLGGDADYTEAVRLLEREAGRELRSGRVITDDGSAPGTSAKRQKVEQESDGRGPDGQPPCSKIDAVPDECTPQVGVRGLGPAKSKMLQQ